MTHIGEITRGSSVDTRTEALRQLQSRRVTEDNTPSFADEPHGRIPEVLVCRDLPNSTASPTCLIYVFDEGECNFRDVSSRILIREWCFKLLC